MSRLGKIRERLGAVGRASELWAARAAAILDAQNEQAREFILDQHLYQGVRCPRRSGKSFSCTSKALHQGETKPGSRILIISLTLKSTIENYWSSAPGGLHVQNALFGLGLKFNNTRFEWFHENGSHGQLVGAETRADLEKIRGALAEADLIIVDECKSFAPELLETLIKDVLEPGLMTRGGKLVLAGTPGSIPVGRFYQATSPSAKITEIEVDDDGNEHAVDHATCFLASDKERLRDQGMSASALEEMWSLHTWTIRDNKKSNPNDPDAAWQRALKIKRRNKWGDDHPTWRREYLGEWVTDTMELVYSYAQYQKHCQWHPIRTHANPTGLPVEKGPWHLIMGLDFGFKDDCALIYAGWSDTVQELRVFHEFKSPNLLPDQFAEVVTDCIDQFGQPEVIVGDRGGTGITYIETMNQRYGLSVIPAEKREKTDFQELLSSDFCAGRVKIVPIDANDVTKGSLHLELCGLQWDLSKDSKEMLARRGVLKEDPTCPNHLCDALLYAWRYSYHYWARPVVGAAEVGSERWQAEEMSRQVESVLKRRARDAQDPFRLRKFENSPRPGEARWTKLSASSRISWRSSVAIRSSLTPTGQPAWPSSSTTSPPPSSRYQTASSRLASLDKPTE